MSNFSENFFKGAEKRPSYVSAKMCLKVAKNIERVMGEQQINNSALAELMGCSKAYITKILRGDANLTIETLAKLSIALNCEPIIQLKTKTKSNSDWASWVELLELQAASQRLNEVTSEWSKIVKSITATLVEPNEIPQSAKIFYLKDHAKNALDSSCSAA